MFEGRDLGTLGDNELAELRPKAFGFVFQQFNPIPTRAALENVECRLAPVDVSQAEPRERTGVLLADEPRGNLGSQTVAGVIELLAGPVMRDGRFVDAAAPVATA